MAQTAVAATAPSAKATTPKKKKAKAAKVEKKPAAHPPAAKMVLAAITNLKERNGASLQAIKKYIGVNFKCDVAKWSVYIRKALVNGVEKGTFTQRKGTGASGSFKLAVKETAPKKAKAAGEKKPKAAAAAAKTVAKKAAAPKKQKATKSSKTVAKKPRTPKPKKATPAAKKAPAATK